ncbi:hypothetical protein F5Y14DRAFT_126948 [Nemania sp. NC0429]|nr:hypothetical protein F5Y14DRAFT_126948 [Nemania sp. NC0429]
MDADAYSDASAAVRLLHSPAALSDTDDTASSGNTEHPPAGYSDYYSFGQSQRLGRDATRYRNTPLNLIRRAYVWLFSRHFYHDGGQGHLVSPSHAILQKEPDTLSFRQSLDFMFSSSYINHLVIFVPIGIVTYYLESHHLVVFATNAIAIVPLSNILAHATECIAIDLGDAVGALMNISFGNLVEIIMFFAALRHGHIHVVKSALVGSILVNLLLILGTSIIAAEFQPAALVYDMNNAQALACLLSLSVFSILIPMAFHFTFKHEQEREYAVRTLSRASAIILLIVYFVYLFFLLVPRRRNTMGVAEEMSEVPNREERDAELGITEPYIVASEPDIPQAHLSQQPRAEQRSQPLSRTIKFADEGSGAAPPRPSLQEIRDGNLWDEPEDPPSSRRNRGRSTSLHLDHDNVQRWMKGSASVSRTRVGHPQHSRSISQSSLGTTRSLRANDIVERYGDGGGHALPSTYSSFHIVEPTNDIVTAEPTPPKVNRMAAIVMLIASTLFTAVCAEFLVDTIQLVIQSSGLTQSFIGLIILSIVGNAAEYITGVRVAARGKLDLSIGVSFGSSIQIALFVSPLTVIGGWIMGKNMTLYLGVFETTALVGAAILVNFLMTNGKTNYLEGTLLCACYLITGIGSYFIP